MRKRYDGAVESTCEGVGKLERAPIGIELFAGAGGLGEGLLSAGLRIAAAVELHPQPALTYAFNHPDTSVFFGDIRNIKPGLLAAAVSAKTENGQLDYVAGGPPCQGFSTAGRKKASDPRNSLFHQFINVVAELRPRMFLLENVPGFKKMHNGDAYLLAKRLFQDLGYELEDRIVEASGYGVPQRRQRFIMVGRLPDLSDRFEWPVPLAANNSAMQISLLNDLRPFVTVYEALEDIAFLRPGWEAHRHQGRVTSVFQAERRNECPYLFNHLASQHRPRTVEMFSHIGEGQTISRVPEHLRSGKRTMARLARDRISNTVLALPDDLIHYRHDRIPTVREMARLQTFDDDYVFIGKRTSGFMERRIDVPQYTQVGNAVPPLLGRALGGALARALGGTVRDLRDIAMRRERHKWVLGSSGFAGYSLDPIAQGLIDLHDVQGDSCELPVSDVAPQVIASPDLAEWKCGVQHRRGQWAPGVSTTREIVVC